MPISVIQRTRAIGFPLVDYGGILLGAGLHSQSSLAAATSSHGRHANASHGANSSEALRPLFARRGARTGSASLKMGLHAGPSAESLRGLRRKNCTMPAPST